MDSKRQGKFVISTVKISKICPIIAMSANAFAEDVRLSLEAGMNEHIAKPIEIDKLYGIMRKWFQ